MARNDSLDRGMERMLRDHFAAESDRLRAPEDTWQRLEGRLDAPRQSWLAWGRRGWRPVLAAATSVAVVAVIAASAILIVSDDDMGNRMGPMEEAAPSAAMAAAPTTAPTAPSAAMAERTRAMAAPTRAMAAAAPTTAPAVPTAAMAMPTKAMAMMPAPAPTTAAEAPTEPSPPTETRGGSIEGLSNVPGGYPVPTSQPPQTAAAQLRSAAPGATTFQDYRRQPAVATSEDAVSTFSLDTDRTSYHLALNWAREGYEVEPDSVRAEEWINAFDYRYDPPADGWGFAISSEIAPHPLDGEKHLARISFQAAHVQDDRPLNVTLVLDASGSMDEGNRVDIARAAAEAIRQSLGSQDRIAVVHFTDDVISQYTVEHSAPDDSAVQSSIDRLAPHGSTNVQAGLNLGVRLADQARRRRPDAYNYIVLMSDGVANVNATNPFEILESAHDADSGNPLRLITIGVGIQNYNDYLLEQLAQHGNGWYRYLRNVDQAWATFRRENWVALASPFADQTRAQVTWDAAMVKSWRIIGYENRVTSDESFVEDRKEFAEIHSGAATTVFFELELHERARRSGAGHAELGDVELRWVVPETGQSRSQRASVWDADLFDRGDSLFQLGAIVALAADLYGGLPFSEDRGYPGAAYNGMLTLSDRLESLRTELGELHAYQDFAFLLAHITEAVGHKAGPSGSSGYSQ